MTYDLQTQALMQEIKVLDESLDKAILPKLKQLEKTATALNDDYLLGFTYYYYSFATYYLDEKRKKFAYYLSLAIHYLMRVEDHEMLARVFNMVAIDAYGYGSYDVTYNYYMNALHEAEAIDSELFQTVIETNLSLLFLELRDFKRAKRHIEKAIDFMSVNKDVKPFSLHAAYVDEAAIYLELKNYVEARKSYEKAIEVLPKANAPDEDLKLSLSLIEFRLAHAEKKDTKELEDRVINCLKEELYPDGYIGDIRNLCHYLLEVECIAMMGRVLEAVNDRIVHSGRIHIIRIFSTLKVDYARALKDDKYLKACLEEQQEYIHSHKTDVNLIQKYILELVELDNTIRNERLLTKKEHAHLEQKVYHDALTGIANRRMLNKLLSSSFERAYQNNALLGIELLDFNQFKEYNDTFGHLAGDECLKSVVKVIEQLCERNYPNQASMYCGRYGGDEFVLIYEGFNQEQILSLAKELNEQIKSLAIEHPSNKIEGIVTVSQGICVGIPEIKQRIWDFLAEADEAMYMVKRSRLKNKPLENGTYLCEKKSFVTKELNEYGR
ncbi:MAG: GGDEF domain-containing protein [Solobacterium sp.]|nr:GGDEF domain-containing protein [Solobacterium sp.]